MYPADTGGDERDAKKLAKELRLEVKRAKTELDIEPNTSYQGQIYISLGHISVTHFLVFY